MKILHTSDWHLGKRLDNFSRLPEQQSVLNEICEVADREAVDVVVVAGDLFDSFNPSTEAIDLFYKVLKRLTKNGERPVIAIAGNHDSPDRIEAPDPLARECGIIFAGYPNSKITPFVLDTGLKVMCPEEGFIEINIPGTNVPLRVLLTPYSNEYRLKKFLGIENSEEELRVVLQKSWGDIADKYFDDKGVNILISHLFVVKKGENIMEEPDDEKPILHVGGAQAIYTENIPDQIQYTALGHLHRMHCIADNPGKVIYSGSPLSYSFSESNQKKYVVIADIQPGEQPSIAKIELLEGKKLFRKKVKGVDEALKWLGENQDCLVELTIETETFLTATERKQLSSVHQGIVSVIPEVENAEELTKGSSKNIDLSKSMEDLFCDYFNYEKGQEPGEDLMEMFKEILAEE